MTREKDEKNHVPHICMHMSLYVCSSCNIMQCYYHDNNIQIGYIVCMHRLTWCTLDEIAVSVKHLNFISLLLLLLLCQRHYSAGGAELTS